MNSDIMETSTNNNIRNSKIKKYIPLINKLLVSCMGFYFYLCCDEYNYFLTKKVIFSYTTTYYIIETFVYFYNKEYIFIPHHFCTLGMLYFFYNFPFHLLKPVLLGMGIIEKSGAITDYRDILKHDNQLTLFYDVSFLLYYISIRQFYFAYHIYYDYPLDTIEQKINVFFLSLLYIMSFYWSIIWTKSIIKYNKLLKND